LVNGKVRCQTPCLVKYRWREAEDEKITFAVVAPGYKHWSDTITEKPRLFDDRTRVSLDRVLPAFDLGTASAIVGFDKLLVDIKDGTEVGSSVDETGKSTPIKWEGGVKVGEKAFERRFYEVLGKAGFRIPSRPDPQLFSDGGRTQQPRFLVGVQVLEVGVHVRHDTQKDFGDGAYVGATALRLEWKVLDRSTGKVVQTVTTRGRASFRHRKGSVQSDNLTAFEHALINFLNEGSFVELVRSNTSQLPLVAPLADSANVSFKFERPSIPAFKNLGEMIRHADRSCVTIITDAGHGSGVIINREGWVLSAQHVVDGTNRVEVQFSDGLRQDATILYANVEYDVVLLDIAGSGYRSLPLAVNDSTGIGDEVVTIGTPADLALGQSVSKGILSGKRKVDDKVYLQTDVAVNPGNSGGPLLNAQGEVIGIIQSKLVGKGIEGLGFAVPIERVMELLNIRQE
jgi:S1-C subfamily serine protease